MQTHLDKFKLMFGIKMRNTYDTLNFFLFNDKILRNY